MAHVYLYIYEYMYIQYICYIIIVYCVRNVNGVHAKQLLNCQQICIANNNSRTNMFANKQPIIAVRD